MAEIKTADAPVEQPEAMRREGTSNEVVGSPAYDLQALMRDTVARTETRPSQTPPSEVVAAESQEGITAWHRGKKITAMWCNASNRNAYAAIPGLGWRKLSNANDSSFLSMVMLASHAETTHATVNVNIGSDNKIHEIYVW